MSQNRLFFNLYQQISGWRIAGISVLLLIGAGVLYYFNSLGKALEEREQKYATLYATSIRFFIEQGIDSPCDYTFISEVVEANETIPTILVSDGVPVNYSNISELEDSTKKYAVEEVNAILEKQMKLMAAEHEPIPITLPADSVIADQDQTMMLYYSSSLTLKELKFFPYILLATFLIFGLLAFIAYSSSRRAEQNRVWVGLAKETAHQLGTPISGLLGWIGVLRTQENFDQSIGDEMEKDVERLETITTRFSNIGSVPVMKAENLGLLVVQTASYLERRISTKIKWSVINDLPATHMSMVNRHLMEWVIENLCKNAVDAMAGTGNLSITIFETSGKKVGIDITDTGKGISKANLRKVFSPGFSTKKRGWGLGLTLAKRIVETYHNGRLMVLKSEPGKGTTFRILMD